MRHFTLLESTFRPTLAHRLDAYAPHSVALAQLRLASFAAIRSQWHMHRAVARPHMPRNHEKGLHQAALSCWRAKGSTGRSVLADHRDGDGCRHVGVQSHDDLRLTNGLQRAFRHADSRLLDHKALGLQRLGDVSIGD